MTRRVAIFAAIVLAISAVATAGTQTPTATRPPARAASGQPATVSAKKPAPATTPAVNPASVRTLDAIRIEGEIDVPQVLFITARDYRRFRDATPARYQTTPANIAKTIPLPNRVRLVAPIE